METRTDKTIEQSIDTFASECKDVDKLVITHKDGEVYMMIDGSDIKLAESIFSLMHTFDSDGMRLFEILRQNVLNLLNNPSVLGVQLMDSIQTWKSKSDEGRI